MGKITILPKSDSWSALLLKASCPSGKYPSLISHTYMVQDIEILLTELCF